MNSQPLVSILMNCYNGEKYLKQAIDSIYAQTYQNWEIIFIDNCSTDDSAKVVKSYDFRLKYYKTKENMPLGAARNWALQFIASDFLAFLDTDDIWMDNKLEIQMSKMLAINASLSYTSSDYINNNGNIFHTNLLIGNETTLCAQLDIYRINMQSVIININKHCISFDENLLYAPDFKLFMSILAESNNDAIAISDVLVQYRVHEDSLSNRSLDIKYNEIVKILYWLQANYHKEIEQCLSQFEKALALSKLHKANFLLSNGEYLKAAKIYYELKSFRYTMYIKAIIFSVPIVNRLLYKYLMYKKMKKLR